MSPTSGNAGPATDAQAETGLPPVVDRATFEAGVNSLRREEKAHTRAGAAIAAARRKLPAVEIDPRIPLIGANGSLPLIDAFEGRTHLIAYYFMWHPGRPASEQCEGCTFYTAQVGELSYLNSRDVTFAVFCQGSYDESVRYRDFMGWTMPWYSAERSLPQLLPGRNDGMFKLVCYLRHRDRVYETYWTTGRGVEAMDYTYSLLDLTVHGRQEPWEESPPGWPQPWRVDSSIWRTEGRPTAQWSRLLAGRSDELSAAGS